MAFLIFLFFLFFPNSVFATDDIKITNYSSKGSNEWIEIFNNSSNPIDLSGWYFKDADNNPKTLSGCISPNSNKIFDYYQFLNDKEGETLSLYNQNEDLVHNYGSLEIVQKDKSIVINTCELCSYTYSSWSSCSSSGTQTRTYTSSPNNCFGTPEITTESCTYISPIPTPSKNSIILTEFMPYTGYEWVEIHNKNNFTTDLNGWTIYDSENKIFDIGSTILANDFLVIDLPKYKLNDTGDSIILKNTNGEIITQYTYPSGKYINSEISWSFLNNEVWCQADYSPGNTNAKDCYSAPTTNFTPTLIPTDSPVPTATPTPDPTKYTADESATASAVIEPTTEPNFLSPTSVSDQPSSSDSDGLVLGNDNLPSDATRKNYLPLILIIFGGLLLASPAIIAKIKSKKVNK